MLFDRDIDPSCVYCRYSTVLGHEEIACIRRGIMKSYGSCGSFRYEPTKRVPEHMPALNASGLTEEDFAI